MVQMEPVLAEAEQEGKLARGIWHLGQADEALLKRLVASHARYTASAQAKKVLDGWARYRSKFVKIFPHEYRRALGELTARGGKRAA
jgi:glutamate synthase domain-containing protein 3